VTEHATRGTVSAFDAARGLGEVTAAPTAMVRVPSAITVQWNG
jgi:hypothetical protein